MKTKNLVGVSVGYWNENDFKIVPNAFDEVIAKRGYANLIGEEIGTIRYYSPFEEVNHQKYPQITTAIVKEFDPLAYQELVKRHKKEEVINYTNILLFWAVEASANNKEGIKIIFFIIRFCLVGFMCGDFRFMVLRFMMIRVMVCFVFQSMMVVAENRLKVVLSVEPGYQSFIKINDVYGKSYHIQRVFHFQLDLKFIKNKDTEIGKQYH